MKFYDLFQRNRIYFSEEICPMVDDFFKVIGETNLAMHQAHDNLDHSTQDSQKAYSKMAVLMDRLPEIKKLIERDFRALLGVIAPSESASNKALQLTAR